MNSAQPMMFVWDGEAMVPRAPKLADRTFVIGQAYLMGEHQDRSLNTHNHYFAAIAECWKSLPEDKLERYATAEHLRKWALIKAGFREERSIVCESEGAAHRVAAYVQQGQDYAVVVQRGVVVITYTAKSQSVRAMGKKEFQASKEAVLNVLSELLGVQVGQIPNTEAA